MNCHGSVTLKRRSAKLSLTFVFFILLLLLAGCGGGSTPYDFISINAVDGSVGINMKMTHDEITGALSGRYGTIGMEQNAGVRLRWKNAQIVSILIVAKENETAAGISPFDSGKSQVLEAYAKDPHVTAIENDDQKIILGKQIDGVHYTLTFRLFPNGDVKTITLTNADEYTEVESDYQ